MQPQLDASLAASRQVAVAEWRSSSRAASARAALRSGAAASASSRPTALGRWSVAAYATGSFLNDAAAAMWFSYLLLFLERVQGLSGLEAGGVLLAGQLADAASTPAVGLASDRSTGCACGPVRLGRRYAFYLGGTALVAVTFSLVFGVCLPCEVAPGRRAGVSSGAVAASFGVWAALFNVGWSAAQVSHQALVPELSPLPDDRLALNSARYAVSVLASVYVFSVAAGILGAGGVGGGGGGDARGPEFAPSTYTALTSAVLALGLALAVVFIAARPAEGAPGGAAGAAKPPPAPPPMPGEESPSPPASPTAAAAASASSSPSSSPPAAAAAAAAAAAPPLPAALLFGAAPCAASRCARDWLACADFYRVALVYTAVRLALVTASAYLPFFITTTLALEQTAIATVPLAVFLSSLAAAAGLRLAGRWRAAGAAGAAGGCASAARGWCGRLGGGGAGGPPAPGAAAAAAAASPSAPAPALAPRALLLAGACVLGVGSAGAFVTPAGSLEGAFFVAAATGAGSAALAVAAATLQAELLGTDTSAAAFVFGAMSFADKVTSGVVIVALQAASDGLPDEGPAAADFFRAVFAFVPLAAAGVAVAAALAVGAEARAAARAADARRRLGLPTALVVVESAARAAQLSALNRAALAPSAAADEMLELADAAPPPPFVVAPPPPEEGAGGRGGGLEDVDVSVAAGGGAPRRGAAGEGAEFA